MAKASRITEKRKYLMNTKNTLFIIYWGGGRMFMLLFRCSPTICGFELYSLVPYKKPSTMSKTGQAAAERIGRVHGWE